MSNFREIGNWYRKIVLCRYILRVSSLHRFFLILGFLGTLAIRQTYSGGILTGIENPSCVPLTHVVDDRLQCWVPSPIRTMQRTLHTALVWFNLTSQFCYPHRNRVGSFFEREEDYRYGNTVTEMEEDVFFYSGSGKTSPAWTERTSTEGSTLTPGRTPTYGESEMARRREPRPESEAERGAGNRHGML